VIEFSGGFQTSMWTAIFDVWHRKNYHFETYLLAWSFSSCWFTCGLLGTCHLVLVRYYWIVSKRREINREWIYFKSVNLFPSVIFLASTPNSSQLGLHYQSMWCTQVGLQPGLVLTCVTFILGWSSVDLLTLGCVVEGVVNDNGDWCTWCTIVLLCAKSGVFSFPSWIFFLRRLIRGNHTRRKKKRRFVWHSSLFEKRRRFQSCALELGDKKEKKGDKRNESLFMPQHSHAHTPVQW